MNDYGITKEMLESRNDWFSILLLLFIFGGRNNIGDETECTETTTDTTIQQEI